MKDKRGFTLIELLAVIVILAIIALVIVPVILNMISKARKSAAKDSALGYIDSINYNNELASMNSDYETGYTKINDGENIDVTTINSTIKMKGKKPESGTVTINSKGKVTSANDLCFEGYAVDYDGKTVSIDTEASCSSSSNNNSGSSTPTAYTPGQLVQYDPVENTGCTTGSTCYKWRVITTDDTTEKDNITIQLDHNLVNKSAWSPSRTSTGPTTALSALATATADWDDSLLLNYTYDTTSASSNFGVLTCTNGTCKRTINNSDAQVATNVKARIITGEEVRALTMNAGATNESRAGIWTLASGSYDTDYYFSNSGHTIGTKSTGTNEKVLAWLIENTEEFTSSGATANAYGDNNNGYWTLSPVSNDYKSVWYLNRNGGFLYYTVNNANSYGLRPVITIAKSNLN